MSDSAAINFPGQYQILSQWCWLACASGTINYYLGAADALDYTQCKLAVQEGLSNTACSQNINGNLTDISNWVALINAPGDGPMHYNSDNGNSPGNPANALNNTGKVTGAWGQPNHDVDWMIGELNQGYPVIGHITWDNNNGHIIVFYGASKVGNDNHYNVADPWVGNSLWINGAVTNGRWDNCASTRKN